MLRESILSLLLSPVFLLSPLSAALPSSGESSTSLAPRAGEASNSTSAVCIYTPTWYIGNFHTYQAASAPIIPYQAFYFSIYDSSGSFAEASCSRTGKPGQQVGDLLFPYDPAVWYPCHVYNGKATNFDHSPNSRSNYYFQWNDQQSTIYVKGRGKCGSEEIRSEKLQPLKIGGSVFSHFSNGDLGDESVNKKGYYNIYGPGGEVWLRHDGQGNPVKSFD